MQYSTLVEVEVEVEVGVELGKKNSDFKFHKLEAHEGIRYSCYQCDYEVTSKQS